MRATPSVDLLTRVWANQVQTDEHGSKYLSRPLEGDARAILERRLREIDRLLLPWRGKQEEARVTSAVARMLSGWDRGGNATSVVASYCATLNDLPVWAIERACDQIGRGQLVDLNPDFRPSAARVHSAVADVIGGLQRERHGLKFILEAPTKDEQAATPDERERVVGAFKRLAEELRGPPREDDKRLFAARHHRVMARTDAAILAEWQAAGLKPIMNEGRPMSLTLARMLRAKAEEAV